jgi:transcriptional regulator of acetoin/glycerol metabolism
MKYYKTIQVEGKQVRLHRYLMEQKIGRKLSFNEIVHHKNGKIFDNSLENLEIISRGEHIKLHPEVLEAWKESNTYKFNNNDIIKMYETMSIQKISEYFGVASMTIWYRLKKENIKTHKPGYKYEKR